MAMVTGVVWSLVGALSGGVLAQETEPDPDIANRMPGLGSFIVFAFLAVALYFLLKNMNARLRRMSYREREREAQEAAEQEGAEQEGAEREPAQEQARPADDPHDDERG